VSERLLSIGDLSARTGVAVTALRYYDELGLVRPSTRESGQRRYPDDAVRAVGVVIFLRDIGFSLAEIAELTAITARTDRWSELVDDRLAEIAEQQHRLTVARTALEHARDCPAEHPSRCPRFWSIIDARLEGTALEAADVGGSSTAH
jgi:DNA-binding transcriptional MerR regulator